ncbi:juvenile hormone esterase-like isoform X2 [Aricia agestis]|uniref:juvenile hormone esterase-like isoform X2 n=1 Tax=Aricia agestis TaxID=91739 RepID=UPI001C20890E|nr:juvenile hormone esterase-like isoform X2 [Aricia agestis]
MKSSHHHQRDPIVTVKEGQLRGSVTKAIQGFSYYSFKGIPYAQPPVGNLRFKAPQPPQPWQGIRDATQHGPICAQFNVTFQGSEDCLFLNIYTRSLRRNAKLPVMVFIHGGSYYEGSGDSDTFGADFLIQHDVILVTINYRLELLGFLSLDTPEVPGNAGMKDQVAALRWIQDNIKQFGGDKNSVTIFGESSGASSVMYHMLSPMSEGLFHKVIAESGTCIDDWAIATGAVERAFRAGEVLGKKAKSKKELLDFFRSLDAPSLTNLTFRTLTPDEEYRGLPEKFIPRIESKFEGVEAFIDENPLSLLVKGKINKVPLMFGYNSGEGLILVDYHITRLDVYNRQPSFYVPRELAKVISEQKLHEFGERIKAFYVGNRNITKDDKNIISDMQTDMHFSYNTHRFAYLYSDLADVYLYRFNYDTELNIIKIALGLRELDGVSHADELFYLFYNYLSRPPYESQKKIRDIVFQVTKMWTDFAKYGRPASRNCSEIPWTPYTKAKKEYFNIGEEASLGYYADKRRIQFWDKLYAESNVPHIGN